MATYNELILGDTKKEVFHKAYNHLRELEKYPTPEGKELKDVRPVVMFGQPAVILVWEVATLTTTV